MAWSASRPLSPSQASDSPQQLLPTRRSSNAPQPVLPPPTTVPSASLSPTSAPLVDSFAMPALPLLGSAPTLATSNQRNPTASNKLFAIFFLIVCSCGIGLVSVSTLLQGSNQRASSLALSTQLKAEPNSGLRRGAAPTPTIPMPTNANAANQTPTTQTGQGFPTHRLPVAEKWKILGNLDDYECVAWRPCKDCSPYAPIDVTKPALPCNATIANGAAGFCEVRHKTTQQIAHVMEMHCDSLRPSVEFKCDDFASILSYGRRAPQYVHDPTFSFDTCRSDFVQDQKSAGVAVPSAASTEPDVFFRRGIAIVVYEKLLESVFASIKSMRQLGSTLPVELWYIAEETNIDHPILKKLTAEYGAYLREIKDPRASRFYTKIYAVFYSAFDQVLLLDADNFAVRDPAYLFDTPEFVATGAIFWPDFWRFKKTIFNIQPTSFVWDVLDLDPVDMFEQESGQVAVDRRRHVKAMNVMMYYAFHPAVLETLRLVWGDKDLFRFAWMKTESSFHMIKMPPGAAGLKLPDRNVFCGVTMVQHDPNNDVLFLHRNQEKLTSENRRIVWSDLQQFKLNHVSLDEYDVRGANGGRYYPMYKRCYGKDIYYEKAFVVTPIAQLPFAGLETRLLDYVHEAAKIANASKPVTDDE